MQLSNNNLHDLRQANSFLIATSGKTAGKKKRLFSTKAATFVMWNYPLQKFAKKKTLGLANVENVTLRRPNKAEPAVNGCLITCSWG